MADYHLNINYEGSESKNEPVTYEEKEENSDAEFACMEMPHEGTFHQRMTPCNAMQKIIWGTLRART